MNAAVSSLPTLFPSELVPRTWTELQLTVYQPNSANLKIERGNINLYFSLQKW